MGIFSKTVITNEAVLLGRGGDPARKARVRNRLETNPRKARQYRADRERRGGKIAAQLERDGKRRRDN